MFDLLLQNGDAGLRNGNSKVAPDLEPVPGIVGIEFETREASAKAGKDFKYTTDSLVRLDAFRVVFQPMYTCKNNVTAWYQLNI